MTARRLIIAIDGPSGAGKGTIARSIARHLGYRHVDTGAMYRAVAWKALRQNVDPADAVAVGQIARDAIFDLGDRVRIDGHDVTDLIRTPEIDDVAAVVARHPAVRSALVERQRGFSTDAGLVMEGRDIGTVVFPAADVKLYLDATPEERARRRAGDEGHAMSRRAPGLDRVAQALESRDRLDRTRPVSPLTIAPDATYIDTTGVPVDTVVARVLAIVDAAIAHSPSR